MLSGLVDPGLDSLEEPVLDRARLLGDVGDTCGSSTTESVPSMPCAFLMMTPSGILSFATAISGTGGGNRLWKLESPPGTVGERRILLPAVPGLEKLGAFGSLADRGRESSSRDMFLRTATGSTTSVSPFRLAIASGRAHFPHL
jgi:hypothetical protein